MSKTELPAIAGGSPVLPVRATWPVMGSPTAERYTVEAIKGGRTCGYGQTDSPFRRRLETTAAKGRGYAHMIATGTGGAALQGATVALLVDKGPEWCRGRDTVVVPVWGVVQHAQAISDGVYQVLGFRPKIQPIDVSVRDTSMDPALLEAYLQEHHERVLLVCPIALDTLPDLARIVPSAHAFEIPVLLDGAQCAGVQIPRDIAPDADTRSRQWGKFDGAAPGEGGDMYFNRPELAYHARRWTDLGNRPTGLNDPTGGNPPAGHDTFPYCGNNRYSGTLAAAALGCEEDMHPFLPDVRATRAELGTEIRFGGGVVFEAPEQDWSNNPMFASWLRLTAEAEEAYGLTASQWREALVGEGFAVPEAEPYRFGVRTGYAHIGRCAGLAQWGTLQPGSYPRGSEIDNWLLLHVGLFFDPSAPANIQTTVHRVLNNLDAVHRALRG